MSTVLAWGRAWVPTSGRFGRGWAQTVRGWDFGLLSPDPQRLAEQPGKGP